MPQFGGYDPIALARGVALAGNPLEWQIVGDRLYLFYSAQARAHVRGQSAGGHCGRRGALAGSRCAA